MLSSSSSLFLRTASTAAATSASTKPSPEELRAAIPARYGAGSEFSNSPRTSPPDGEENLKESQDPFAHTKRLLSYAQNLDRSDVAALIEKCDGYVEHFERFTLPGIRRDIYCAIMGYGRVIRDKTPAISITREKLAAAIAKKMGRRIERNFSYIEISVQDIHRNILPTLRRDVYCAITGVGLSELPLPLHQVQMDKLSSLMRTRSKGDEHYLRAIERERGRISKIVAAEETRKNEEIQKMEEFRKREEAKRLAKLQWDGVRSDKPEFIKYHAPEVPQETGTGGQQSASFPATQWPDPQSADRIPGSPGPVEELERDMKPPTADSGLEPNAEQSTADRGRWIKPQVRLIVTGRDDEWLLSSRKQLTNTLNSYQLPPSPTIHTPTRLPHLTPDGSAHMVNVANKESTHRVAVAIGYVHFASPATHRLVANHLIQKGDVLGTARVAGIMAAKNCPALVPLCHPIAISGVEVDTKLLGQMELDNLTGPATTVSEVGVLASELHHTIKRFVAAESTAPKQIGGLLTQYAELRKEIEDYRAEIGKFIVATHDYRKRKQKLGSVKIDIFDKEFELFNFKSRKSVDQNAKALRMVEPTFLKVLDERLVEIQRLMTHRIETVERLEQKAKDIEALLSKFPDAGSDDKEDVESAENSPESESGDNEVPASGPLHTPLGNVYGGVRIEAKVECVGPTGVEMEALTAVSAAALTVIDMIKAVDRQAKIDGVKVVLKRGGKSGLHIDAKWVNDPHRVYEKDIGDALFTSFEE